MIPLRSPGGCQQLNGHPRSQLQQQQQHLCCRPVPRCKKLEVLCRYDLRKSASNVEERRQRQLLPGTSAAERSLTQQQLKDAKATLVHQRAHTLCGASKGQLSHHLCLFLLTEQPALIHVNSGLLASRIATLADVLGLTQPDTAELLVRNGAILDVLPLRVKSAAEALCIALGVSKQEALVMLATDISLLDTPPLRLKQQLQELSELLQVQFDVLAVMAAACPHLTKVEPSAVQIRWTNLQALLQLSSPHLQALLQQEPRMLMPSSQTLSQNHTAICETLGVSPETLNRWVVAAPLLLLVPAAQLQKRAEALACLMLQEVGRLGVSDGTAAATAAAAAAGNSTSTTASIAAAGHGGTTTGTVMRDVIDAMNSSSSSSSEWVSVVSNRQQFTAYISKDPRVLLLKPKEIPPRLAVVQQELCCSHDTLMWLLLSHPSYLVVEPGSVTSWMHDVRHLTQMSAAQAIRLVLCPQVFLTMSPEEVYMSLANLRRTLQLQHATAVTVAAQEPLLLQQHPALTAAALQQLFQLIPVRRLCHQLLLMVPELLLQGQQLQQRMPAAAALLTLTCTQLAVALVREPSLWWVLVPRNTWPGMQQQQQQVLSPAAAAVVASMSALLNSGLRSPAVMQQVAVLQPLLLKLGCEAVHSHVLQLVEVCEGCAHWQQQLQAVSPEVLGKCILKITVWKPRLAFLLDTRLAGRVPLQEVISMSRNEFERCFSAEYRQWKLAHKAQQHWNAMQQWQRSEQQQHWQRQRQQSEQQQQQQQQQWQQSEHQRQQQWQQFEQQQQWQGQQPEQQQQQQQQQEIGRQQSDREHHTDSLVAALEAFLAAQPNASSSSSSSSSSGGVGGGGDGEAASRARKLFDTDRYPHPVSNGGSSNSSNDIQEHNMLQHDQQQQHHQVHPKSAAAAATAATAAAEGEVFYYNSSGLEAWEVDNITSSCSGGNSSSYDGGASDSNSWDSTQQQQQQEEEGEGEGEEKQPILLHLPFVRQADMQLLAVQHSAADLYGSWQGSLVRPAYGAEQQ